MWSGISCMKRPQLISHKSMGSWRQNFMKFDEVQSMSIIDLNRDIEYPKKTDMVLTLLKARFGSKHAYTQEDVNEVRELRANLLCGQSPLVIRSISWSITLRAMRNNLRRLLQIQPYQLRM